MEEYLTREGYIKLLEELTYLKQVKRREFSQAIGEARAHGDIGENAEYDAAKDAQALNEKRIVELEYKLSNVRILEDEAIDKDKVFIGAKVKLKDLDTDEELEYTLVSELEADYAQGKISVNAPIAKSLLGHRVEDAVKIEIPAGILRYKILKISR